MTNPFHRSAESHIRHLDARLHAIKKQQRTRDCTISRLHEALQRIDAWRAETDRNARCGDDYMAAMIDLNEILEESGVRYPRKRGRPQGRTLYSVFGGEE